MRPNEQASASRAHARLWKERGEYSLDSQQKPGARFQQVMTYAELGDATAQAEYCARNHHIAYRVRDCRGDVVFSAAAGAPVRIREQAPR